MTRATHKREVSLSEVDKRFSGVIAVADEPIFVGAMGKSAILLGALPEGYTTETEVRSFVKSLLEHDRVMFGTPSKGVVPKEGDSSATRTTHAIVTRGGKKMLVRIRILCCA